MRNKHGSKPGWYPKPMAFVPKAGSPNGNQVARTTSVSGGYATSNVYVKVQLSRPMNATLHNQLYNGHKNKKK